MFMLTNWFTGVRTIKANMEWGGGPRESRNTLYALPDLYLYRYASLFQALYVRQRAPINV